MDHVTLETVKTADLPRGRRARWLTKLQQYKFTIKHRGGRTITHADAMSRLPGESNVVDKIPIKALRNEMKRRASQAKFVMVIVHDRDGVRMSLRYGEVMKNMWQLPGGKTDGEPSMEAALQELEEETGLVAEPEDLKFLINDPNYNCDIYTLKVHPNTELDLMELDKNGEWEKFSFEAYERMAREGRITPTHTTCIEPILHRIKPKSQPPKRKATKQAQPKGILQKLRFNESNEAHVTEMAEAAELANYRWWDEPEEFSWTRFNHMEDTAVTPVDNKRYTKVDEYEALLDEEENGIEYEEKLIDYDEDHESYDPYLD